MKLRTLVFFQWAVVMTLACCSLVGEAMGGSITIDFQGTVGQPMAGYTMPTGVAVGQILSGSFTYVTTQTGKNGVYSFAGTNQTSVFSIPAAPFSNQNSNVAGWNTYTITITDTGSKGATFDLAMDMVNAAGKGNKDVTLDIKFTSTTYTGLALPQTGAAFNSAFAVSAGTFEWDPKKIEIRSDDLMANGVPEPSGLVLASIGMATCAASVLISRRHASAVAERRRRSLIVDL
jgi:hypothetical protein